MGSKQLKEEVYEANMELFRSGLVFGTFGNVSGIDENREVVVIKPSGVNYDELTSEKMVGVALKDGKVVEGTLNPSSDTPTHIEIYRAFESASGVVHTHSEFATAFSQARRPIRCMGTTHADYFYGDIPISRPLTEDETINDYEINTGLVIVETFNAVDSAEIPAVLVANHGPFAWGSTAHKAVENAMTLEYLAKIEYKTEVLNPTVPTPPQYLIDKHYLRKHGKNAYYGQ
jgi:L-ribulose-5-phosphate 4-epimerase